MEKLVNLWTQILIPRLHYTTACEDDYRDQGDSNLKKKLAKRLDGSNSRGRCRNCDMMQLVNNTECYCCCGLEECQESMRSKELIGDLQAKGIQNAKCVTQHPRFNLVCVQKWNLKMAAEKFKGKIIANTLKCRHIIG